MSESADRRVEPVLVSAFLALGVAVRLWDLGFDALWVDEAYSLAVARAPLAGCWESAN